MLSVLRYLFSPISTTMIPKVEVVSDGFVLQGKKIKVSEVEAACLFQSTIPLDSCFFQIKTTDNLYSFFGEHQNLQTFFNSQLHIETRDSHSLSTVVSRWKQPGKPYRVVSLKDAQSLYLLEPLARKHVSKLWIIVAATVIVLTCVAAIYFLTV